MGDLQDLPAGRGGAGGGAGDGTGVLAAADVFTVDNAFALVESLRIDAGLLGPFAIHP
ncbi:hypothetical protein [Streptomyces sp. NBC_00271]|uniref:hypothetical protein n=1 Tax=Streptomyces sp. NBC_00271 TaxID=2975697 RepID=UPI002E293DFE|nr:hypothetical protein [Streptomyces sp. NBC_00271]